LDVLKAYPNVPVLGLSATAIRYLDKQRDMSDELFDGNIVSQMTLGDEIVHGILNPILSIYFYFRFAAFNELCGTVLTSVKKSVII